MSFNFSQLQQDVNKLIFNSSEAISKWRDFMFGPAGDLTYQYYDSNGNPVTTTIPNRAKLVNQFIADAMAVMNKTVYIDQANGNDNNTGEQISPFKTLQKAINSVPKGGYVYIKMLNNYTFNPLDWINIENRAVTLDLNGYTMEFPFTVQNVDGTDYLRRGIINCINSVLTIYMPDNSRIISITTDMTTPPTPSCKGLFSALVNYGYGIFNLEFSIPRTNTIENIKINKGSLFGINNNWMKAYGFLGVMVGNPHYNAIVKLENNAGFVDFTSGGGFLYTAINTDPNSDNIFKIYDESNQIIHPKDRVFGIIRDANNIPRNIISNIVL